MTRAIQMLGDRTADAFAGAGDEKGTSGHYTLLERTCRGSGGI
jgi:hypothetical protein